LDRGAISRDCAGLFHASLVHLGWPACWHVAWTVVPTTPRPGAPQIRWRVEIERASQGNVTYWIVIDNLTDQDVDVEARFAIFAAD